MLENTSKSLKGNAMTQRDKEKVNVIINKAKDWCDRCEDFIFQWNEEEHGVYTVSPISCNPNEVPYNSKESFRLLTVSSAKELLEKLKEDLMKND